MSDGNGNSRDLIRRLVLDALHQQVSGAIASSIESNDFVDESTKDVITEADVREVPSNSTLMIRDDAIITPSAQDLIRERSVQIRYRARHKGGARGRIIAIGSDHGGFEMKQKLGEFLDELGYSVRDFGTFSTDAVDYPDYAHAVARAVADGVCDLGIIIDGAGIGSCMTANKVPGVRAAMCYDEATARNSREHNYANVLTLGGKMISDEGMYSLVRVWLATPEGEERHGKRVAKIMAIEKQYLR